MRPTVAGVSTPPTVWCARGWARGADLCGDGARRAAPPPAAACRRHAERFSADRFSAELGHWITAEAAARGISLDAAPVG